MITIAILLSASAQADLAEIKREPNLERRSAMALKNADHALNRARQAYKDRRENDFGAALDELRDSAKLSKESLDATGKPARRNPKHFKKAESALRELLKRLTTLERDVDFEDRERVRSTARFVQDVHDEILNDIMTKKKRE